MIILNEDSRKPIVIQHREDYGPVGIDIRQHYYDDADEMLPTKKGVRIPDENKYEFLAAMMMQILHLDEDDFKIIWEIVLAQGFDDVPQELLHVVEAVWKLDVVDEL